MLPFNEALSEWTWGIQILAKRNCKIRFELDTNSIYITYKNQLHTFSSTKDLIDWTEQTFPQKKKKAVFKHGCWWGLKLLDFVVRQTKQGMLIISRHKSHEAALKFAKKIASTNTIVAPISLIGNPKNKYKIGDYVDPDDIFWQGSPDACSNCLHPFAGCKPTSLDFKCPILAGNIICETIQMYRIGG